MDDADVQRDYTFSTMKPIIFGNVSLVLFFHEQIKSVETKIDSLNAVFLFFTSSFNQPL